MEAQHKRHGLNGLNFFAAAMQTGFGPFVGVWLTLQGWNQIDIGVALSIGSGVALLSQVPGGMLVDAIHRKRRLAAAALVALALAALVLAAVPTRYPVWGAQIVHAVASAILTPAIAVVTLSLCGHAAFGERLGINARYAALGNASAGGLLGAVSYALPDSMIFVLTAAMAIPALIALSWLGPTDAAAADHPALLPRKDRAHAAWQIYTDPSLHVFAVCAVLFHLANAAMLPLALNVLASRVPEAGFVVSAAIVVPPIVVALLSPWAGTMARRIGRRPVLLVGFLALPARALLFATNPDAVPLIAFQVLDGVGATVFGLMAPLIAADLTRRTGYVNLAMGSIGLAAGLGATFSTSMAGWIAVVASPAAAFLALAGVGALGFAVLFLAMPETRPAEPPPGSPGEPGLARSGPTLRDGAT